MTVLMAQVVQIDFGLILGGAAALGLGALQWLTRSKVESVDGQIKSLQGDVTDLKITRARHEQKFDEYERRLSRKED